MDLGRELYTHVAEMPRLEMHAGDVHLILGIAEYEAEPVRVIAKPFPLLRAPKAYIAIGIIQRGDIQRETGAMLARVAGHRADGI